MEPTTEEIAKAIEDELDKIFTYHAPKNDQAVRYGELRKSARAFAKTIIMCVPNCPDKSAAIRKVREAVMTANAGIAINE